MPSTFTRPSTVYQPGGYGPFTIDGFLSADTDVLELVLTVENWPAVASLITGQLRWNTGDGVDFVIDSPPHDRTGKPLPTAVVRVTVPQTATGKAAVTSATARLTVMQPISTAVTFRAVANP